MNYFVAPLPQYHSHYLQDHWEGVRKRDLLGVRDPFFASVLTLATQQLFVATPSCRTFSWLSNLLPRNLCPMLRIPTLQMALPFSDLTPTMFSLASRSSSSDNSCCPLSEVFGFMLKVITYTTLWHDHFI